MRRYSKFKISALTQAAIKSFPRLLIVRQNSFHICWAYFEWGFVNFPCWEMSELTQKLVTRRLGIQKKIVTRWLSIHANCLSVEWAQTKIGYPLTESTRKLFWRTPSQWEHTVDPCIHMVHGTQYYSRRLRWTAKSCEWLAGRGKKLRDVWLLANSWEGLVVHLWGLQVRLGNRALITNLFPCMLSQLGNIEN